MTPPDLVHQDGQGLIVLGSGHGSNLNVHQQRNKEDVLHIYNGILAIEKDEIMPSAATWMNLGTVILNEVSQRERQISYDIAYMWNLNKGYK